MSWQAEAWAGIVCLAAGGILGWTAVIMAAFPPWPRRAIRESRNANRVTPVEDLFDTLPPTRLMAMVTSRD